MFDRSLIGFIGICCLPPIVLLYNLPNLSLQWIIIQSGIFSFGAGLLTYRLIPTISELTSTANLTGMDLNKKGNPKYSGKKIPESLGICVSVVYLVCVILFQLFQWFSFPETVQLSEYNAALTSICFMILLGFGDDVLNLRWRYKLVLPLFASLPLLVAYAGGTSVVVPDINFPVPLREWLGMTFDLGVFYRIYLLMLAIFCTNSINILAGINGLEVGQSVVIAISIIVHNLIELTISPNSQQHLFSLVLMIPFLFTAISLLFYNWYPSRVFVGDTFTYFSGMCFAVVAILCHFSKTLLLFFIPQILNFLYSTPQLFGVIPCPRHRVPKYNPTTDKMEAIPTNLTIINLLLMVTGPLSERKLCIYLLIFQGLCSCIGFGVRYFVAPYFF
ncbi:UDP-N-acetylglucosamine-dolichyl-phosphate N-acetylglucosaminephosphotransferase [Dictyostelium purpureum]|uniref:UDP-N-acetylglucosamine--dolichyl-phosphate N-acetylglucosaminephosphotransferase n=1 Tax=Dictyostelium purpureum TaxID=5786 RepID=F1A1V0_DICPU|nr:UDP-N-acetylglucosamine-dolichyl-phosphate N-acetylglucosaminephosphotransferase [Dictyostelium purpureum]EGC29822.1 UDP-N-acetylglucosamine-dolichyl-phosphate N-acetylglucosaminephosphotransferase [Dictyostelium purpureum]|eukprot:XP_003293643.1 UDP-N-acetylglucosamine-dolichyl-phosphate N-acetylglucosaminephosphotransferase [Dictyostelium purpureum]